MMQAARDRCKAFLDLHPMIFVPVLWTTSLVLRMVTYKERYTREQAKEYDDFLTGGLFTLFVLFAISTGYFLERRETWRTNEGWLRDMTKAEWARIAKPAVFVGICSLGSKLFWPGMLIYLMRPRGANLKRPRKPTGYVSE